MGSRCEILDECVFLICAPLHIFYITELSCLTLITTQPLNRGTLDTASKQELANREASTVGFGVRMRQNIRNRRGTERHKPAFV
jgi:hypothetical protein